MNQASRQMSEGSGHKSGGFPLPTALRPSPTGFTLIEMLIVIGIIILALAMAVPTIRALTGTKSEQSAQNVVSAYLASARADAVGVQDVEGVLFYLDPANGRVTLQEVAQSPYQSGDMAGVVYLDLEGSVHGGKSRDPLVLPAGVQLMTLKDANAYGPSFSDLFPNSRYLGYNYFPPATAAAQNAQLGGVILFNGNGRLFTGQYGFRFVASDISGNPTKNLSPLGILVFRNTPPSTMENWPVAASSSKTTSSPGLLSQIGFAFFDRETFLNQHDPSGNPFLDLNNSNGVIPDDNNPAQTSVDNQANWLDANTTPILVNRYNGTLIRAE